MSNKKLVSSKQVRLEFYKITKILPVWKGNILFDCLAEKVFDNTKLLNLLEMKIKCWLKLEKSEFTYSLAGYIHYFKEDFSKAERYFLKAITKNPQNLSNWFSLAFSLHHQGDKKHNLGKKILFNFDKCSEFFKNKKVTLGEIKIFLKSL